MVLSLMVMNGFRNEITAKVTDFGAHVRLSKFDRNASFEEEPVVVDRALMAALRADPGIRTVRTFATKAGIVKTGDAIQGIVLKGIDVAAEPDYFRDKIRAGNVLSASAAGEAPTVLISTALATLLRLHAGDDIVVYFISDPMRVRKFRIAGLYETGLEEFDKLFAFCDLQLIRGLNGWSGDQVGGVEMTVRDIRDLEAVSQRVYNAAGYGLKTETVRELYPQVFNWLDLINVNVAIILVLMVAVAGLNLIAMLLIVILDNTRLIGVLKAIGAGNAMVRKVFLYVALYVIGAGVLAGNALAFAVAAVQRSTGWFRLPQESYYVSVVPVDFSIGPAALLAAGIVAVCGIMMLLPVMIVSGIRPVRVLRFD